MDSIEINNQSSLFPSDAISKSVKKAIVLLRKKGIIGDEKVQLSIALLGMDEIKSINAAYRKKNKATDVLSFVYENTKKLLIAEILICPDYIKKNKKDYGGDFAWAMKKNIVHGLLHCCGLDHSRKMFALEKDLCLKIK
jgi:probable rRNA maturation factor